MHYKYKIYAWVVGISAIAIFMSMNGFALFMPYSLGTMQTESMIPEIEPGDKMVINYHVEFQDVAEGDIVVFDSPIGIIAHRVVGMLDGGLITKGDANPDEDPYPIMESDYLGRVDGVVKMGPLGVLLTLPVAYVWFAVLGAFMIWWNLRKWKSTIRQNGGQQPAAGN